jgi:hypothetical protein
MNSIFGLIVKFRGWLAAGLALIVALAFKDALRDLVSSIFKGEAPSFVRSIPPTVHTVWLAVAAVGPVALLLAFLFVYSTLRRFRVRKDEAIARLEEVLGGPERLHGKWKDTANIYDWAHQDLAQLSAGFRIAILALTPDGHEYHRIVRDIEEKYRSDTFDAKKRMLELRGIAERLLMDWREDRIKPG